MRVRASSLKANLKAYAKRLFAYANFDSAFVTTNYCRLLETKAKRSPEQEEACRSMVNCLSLRKAVIKVIHIQETKISIPLDGKRLLPFLFRIGLGRLIVPPELNKDGLTSSAGYAGWPP